MPSQRERNAIPSDERRPKEGSVRFAIKIAYDGTDYQGFQSQPHGITIQDQIEARLGQLLRRKLRIFGWGRTDSGVHAKGAVVSVDLTKAEIQRLAQGRKEGLSSQATQSSAKMLAGQTIHSTLKEFKCSGGLGSITARNVCHVPPTFDPRFSCIWKRYIYYISCGSKNRSPFVSRYTWQVDQMLDLDIMKAGAASLTGRHNFEWMSVCEAGELRDSIRTAQVTIEEIASSETLLGFDDNGVMLKVSGTCDFFLYRMMRRIVGILVSLGNGHASLQELDACFEHYDNLETSNSTAIYPIPHSLKNTAPAKGLCLDHIEYGDLTI